MITPRFEVLMPPPGGAVFALDVDSLDGPGVLETITIIGTMVLDAGTLDADTLGGAQPPLAWQDLAGPGTSISIHRGMVRSGPVTVADIGTATLSATAPVLAAVPIGVPCRVTWGQVTLWTGVTTAPGATFGTGRRDQDWEAAYQLTGVDLVAELQQISPEMPFTGSRVADRFAAICGDYQHQIGDAVGTLHDRVLNQLQDPRTVADHLDILATSLDAVWWIDPIGVIRFSERPAVTPPPIMVLSAKNPQNPSFTSADATQDINDVVTGIEFTILLSAWTSETDATIVEKSQHLIWDDLTARATWGRRRAKLTINTGAIPPASPWNPDDIAPQDRSPENMYAILQPWLQRYIQPWTPAPLTISSVTMDDVPVIDIGDLVQIDGLRADPYVAEVITLDHQITPSRTTTTMTLRQRTA